MKKQVLYNQGKLDNSVKAIWTSSYDLRIEEGSLEVIKLNLPAKAGSLLQVSQVGVQMVLNISIERDSTTSPGSLFQCFITLTVSNFLLIFMWNFLCSSFGPLLLVL